MLSGAQGINGATRGHYLTALLSFKPSHSATAPSKSTPAEARPEIGQPDITLDRDDIESGLDKVPKRLAVRIVMHLTYFRTSLTHPTAAARRLSPSFARGG